VELKACSGDPFPSGLGPTRSTEHWVLTSGTGGRWPVVEKVCAAVGLLP
jgi:hypothetical protein